jgi:5-methylcytosine-specific restriction endonuclease McrA
MPRTRASSICAEPGCPAIAPCPTHTPAPWTGSTRRQRLPPGWDKTRQRILRRDGHRCVPCGAPAAEVDHIINNDDHSPSNLQAICHPCHERKTLAEAEAGRRRR